MIKVAIGMTNGKSTTAQTLNEAQKSCLSALLDAVVPASGDGTMPSAGEMDFLPYLQAQAAEFLTVMTGILNQFDDTFADRPLPARVALVQEFARTEARVFDGLVFRIYDCYYQSDRVRGLIGAQLGPPFPNGHDIPAGDFSSLETVKSRAKGYRRCCP